MIVIADTSGFLAAYDRDDAENGACRRAFAAASQVVVSPLVLAELDYLIATRAGEAAAVAVMEDIRTQVSAGAYELADITGDLLIDARTVRLRCLHLALGLTDAVNLALAARYRTTILVTLDRKHYRAVRPITGQFDAFHLWPDDLP